MKGEKTNLIADHEYYMKRCIELARIAQSRDCTPVGSVVVMNGAMVGEGIEALPSGSSITGHAEILACQAALDETSQQDLDGATLYTTAEPCFMCSYAIRQCRISLVVYGIDSPIVGGITSSHPIPIDPSLVLWLPPPRVQGGILWEECNSLSTTSTK